VRIQVLYFAAAREAAGRASETLDLEDGATVAAALDAAARARPALGPLRSALRVAVGERFATPADVLRPGDVIALLPPVSGG
jgi:molybdopterin synthase sulfur carrier subunit